MFAAPAREIESLHAGRHTWHDEVLTPDRNLLAGLQGELFHLRGTFETGEASELRFVIRGTPLVYDVARQELSCQGKKAPLKPDVGAIRLEVLADRTSLEIFGNDGRVYMPIGVIPADDNRSLELSAQGGAARIRSLEVYSLRSAWE